MWNMYLTGGSPRGPGGGGVSKEPDLSLKDRGGEREGGKR